MELEKIFVNDMTYKELVSKIYSSYTSISTNTEPNQKMAEDLKIYFFPKRTSRWQTDT